MSKNRTDKSTESGQVYVAHAAEYRIIRHDLVRVLVLNALYLIGILALFYTNAQSHYLERWFSRLLHF